MQPERLGEMVRDEAQKIEGMYQSGTKKAG